MDLDGLSAIGMPVRPGKRALLRGDEALHAAQRLLRADGIEPEMGAAWVSALETDFPSLYARHPWPTFPVRDRDRFVKLRRLVRAHQARMF